MTDILSLNMVIALGVLLALLAGGLAYAALDSEFDLPIQATVKIVSPKIVSPTKAADVNGDGEVDGADLRTVARSIGMGVLGEVTADVDGNQVVDILGRKNHLTEPWQFHDFSLPPMGNIIRKFAISQGEKPAR